MTIANRAVVQHGYGRLQPFLTEAIWGDRIWEPFGEVPRRG